MNQKIKVAIGLGANIGDRRPMIGKAIQILSDDFLEDAKASRIYESEPWGYRDQPRFLNAVVVGLSEWKPPAIVNYLKNLERDLGRIEAIKNGPRVIDMDLLAYGEERWESDGVVVPHPGIPDRDFVVLPWLEIWPEWKHPVLRRSLKELSFDLPRPQTAKVI